MIAVQIEHVGNFMKEMLLRQTFDQFAVSEASMTTFATFQIDGQLHPEFYDREDELNSSSSGLSLASWKMLRPFCLSVLKGKQLPLAFHFIFQLPESDNEAFLKKNALSFSSADLFGLYLNILYRNQTLTITTGSSQKIFPADKTVDQAWDDWISAFLRRHDLL